jgi:hypothetical protein
VNDRYLRNELDILQKEDSLLNSELDRLNKQSNFVKQKKNKISNRIKRLEALLKESKDLTVTDHAIVRYFERYLGFNIEDIKTSILTDELKNLVKVTGSLKYYNKNIDCEITVKNNTVVSLYKKGIKNGE